LAKAEIIVATTQSEYEDVLSLAHRAKAMGVKIVELRADYLELGITQYAQLAEEVKKILGDDGKVLFTFRTKKEGSKRDIKAEDYYTLIRYLILKNAVDMIDIEFTMEKTVRNELIQLAEEKEIQVVLSSHNFEKTPNKNELEVQLLEMNKLTKGIIKIAVMTQSKEDLLTLISVSNEYLAQYQRDFILIGMGEYGKLTRVATDLFGSAFTFASLEEASAPGQFSVAKTRELMEALSFEG